MALYVRTGNGGTDSDVLIDDLGYTVLTGTSWTELTVGTPSSPIDGYGQFTTYELRYSVDLYALLNSGALEYSIDGTTKDNATYKPDQALLHEFVDDSVTFASISTPSLIVDGYNFTDHLDGGPNKHHASEIKVDGTYSNIPGTPTDLETAISSINTALGATAGYTFSTIVTNTGTSPVADSNADTLTVIGSNGITTSGNATTDTVTIDGYSLLPRDGSRPMTGNLDLGGNKIVNLANPTTGTDGANKNYVDSVATGLDVKNSVRATTTANITLSGTQTVDGVALLVGDRVLVKDQTVQTQNGIYVVASGSWVRSTDADNSPFNEVSGGMFTFIEEGSLYSDTGWVLSSPDGNAVLGTDNLIFTQFSSAGVIVAGAGLTKTGNVLDVGAGNGIQVNADTVEVIYGNVGTISTVDAGDTASAGTNNSAARSDHQHAVSTAAPSTTVKSDAASPSEGTATTLMRSDAQLVIQTATVNAIGLANSQGTSQSLARSDHVHAHNTFAAGDYHTEYTKADGTRPFTGDQSMGGFKLTNVASPVSGTDAANKDYVDSVATGLDVKNSVRATTTANITLSGTQTVDGVALVAGDRILVKDQTTASENGIYVVSAGAWSRSIDADQNAEVTGGLFTFVTEGTSFADCGFVLTTNDPIVVGTTALAFSQFTGAGQIIAGAGLTKTGNQLDVGAGNGIQVNADTVEVIYGSVVAVGTANANGTNNSSSRSDHVHAHGTFASGDYHTEYLKADGTRALTGNLNANAVVTFNPTTSTDPALIITPDSAVPTTGIFDGAVSIVGGVLYIYDNTRSKWLSVDRKALTAGKTGTANNVYLRSHDSVVTSATGYRALRDGTITGMWAQTDTAASWIFEIRRNSVVTAIASLSISAANGNHSATTNVNFSAGDEIQMYANTSGGNITAPLAGIEIAWRI